MSLTRENNLIEIYLFDVCLLTMLNADIFMYCLTDRLTTSPTASNM